MANEIQIDPGLSGRTFYATVSNAAAQIYIGTTPEAVNAAHWASYAVALAEQSTTGRYVGDFPALPAGLYDVSVRQQIGASPATTDPSVGSGTMNWSGTAEVVPTGRSVATYGSQTLTYTLTDSVDGSPIADAMVELYGEAEMTTIIDAQVTNAFGVVVFENLVAGTYYLKRIKVGWAFVNPESEVVQ